MNYTVWWLVEVAERASMGVTFQRLGEAAETLPADWDRGRNCCIVLFLSDFTEVCNTYIYRINKYPHTETKMYYVNKGTSDPRQLT